ncbi:MAG: hypothetical protein QOK44_1276, partial [Betaproteobacteria bacterium]|nr:hypothetical protein [Betaproteobacteria bacterium]
TRHRFSQYAAAATDVQYRLSAECSDTVYVVKPQWIDVVERFELAFAIPPAVRQLAEFLKLERVDVHRGIGNHSWD